MALSDIFYQFMSQFPGGQPAPTSVAQARITRAPIAYEAQQPEPGLWGQRVQNRTWGDYALHHNLGDLGGIDPSQAGYIRIFGGGRPDTLKHEIIHDATIPDLQPGSSLYKNVQKLLPEDVVNTVNTQYKGTQFDPVHEGVSWLLTFPEFQDKKYNDAKLKVINAFSPATRAKITRILGQQ